MLPSHSFLRQKPRIPVNGIRCLPFLTRNSSNEATNSSISRASAPETPRINPVGIQYISEQLRRQLFPNTAIPSSDSKPQLRHTERLIQLAKHGLRANDLLGKKTSVSEPIRLPLPPLHGQTLDEHFHRLGLFAAEPYLGFAKSFAEAPLPPRPQKWRYAPGWTRYVVGCAPEPVAYPEDDCLVFDTELLYKISQYPVMASAVSPTAWYSWVSPGLFAAPGAPPDAPPEFTELLPLGTFDKPKLIVGHNVGFDRARVKEEYSLRQSQAMFLDTMSLHVAVSGMCSRQRPKWISNRKKQREKVPEAVKTLADHRREAKTLELEELLDNPVLDSLGDGLVGEAASPESTKDPWLRKSALNNLSDVAELHCGVKADKNVRNLFSATSASELFPHKFQQLMQYCSEDSALTHRVFSQVLPRFLQACPHPVSFAGLRHIASCFLPTTEKWVAYVNRAEEKYAEMRAEIDEKLAELSRSALELRDSPAEWRADPWLAQLDWTPSPIRYLKKPGPDGKPVLAARQKLPGYPEWYRSLFPSARHVAEGKMKLTVRTRITPLLLKLQWNGRPVLWSTVHGWCFAVHVNDQEYYKSRSYEIKSLQTDPELQQWLHKVYTPKPGSYDAKLAGAAVLVKIPHKDGHGARSTNVMARGYEMYFDKGTLTSELPLAQAAIKMNSACSYWVSSRDRIRSQFVVWCEEEAESEAEAGEAEAVAETSAHSDSRQAESTENSDVCKLRTEDKHKNLGQEADGTSENAENGHITSLLGSAENTKTTKSTESPQKPEVPAFIPRPAPQKIGIILPKIVPMGTVTRRAVENTWLTAANSKKGRIGSELKALVETPPGYCLVGADVDSEELWIASLVGDAVFGIHGGSPIGWMTLEGNKSEGTDLHSRTAGLLGISRNEAKIFNYGRIYGAGVRFACQLLKQFNPNLTEAQVKDTAAKLYDSTKGAKARSKLLGAEQFYRGGTESILFNTLESVAAAEKPQTPALGAGITEALRKQNLTSETFITSRVNWAIQSSGVDYLHLLLVAMEYLIRRYGIEARLCLTVHDEARYFCAEKDRFRVAMALQVANLWTRALFCQQAGIDDVPQGCAFFSGVDFDFVLRKEVFLDCVTPSHPDPIPPGECLGISELLSVEQQQGKPLLDERDVPEGFDEPLRKYEYKPRPRFVQRAKSDAEQRKLEAFVQAQMCRSPEELRNVEKEYRRLLKAEGRAPESGPGRKPKTESGMQKAAQRTAAKPGQPRQPGRSVYPQKQPYVTVSRLTTAEIEDRINQLSPEELRTIYG